MRPPRRERRGYQRTSYLTGELAQCDCGGNSLDRSRLATAAAARSYGLLTTLPYSAAHAAVLSHSRTTGDVYEALRRSVRHLGGVPEGVVVDRDTSIVVSKFRPARVHDPVAALFAGVADPPHRPVPRRSDSEGQVERTIGYLVGRSSRCVGSTRSQMSKLIMTAGVRRQSLSGTTQSRSEGC